MEINLEQELAEKLRSFYPGSRVVDSARDYISIRSPKEDLIGVNIYRSGFVWFYLDDELLNELRAAKFDPKLIRKDAEKRKYKIHNLNLKAVQDNELLFSKVVTRSLNIRDQRLHRTEKIYG